MRSIPPGAALAALSLALGLAAARQSPARAQAAQPGQDAGPGIVIDPCILGSGDSIRAVLNKGLGLAFPLTQQKEGEKVTIANPAVTDVQCPGMTLAIRADVRYQRTKFPKLTVPGSLAFTTPVQVRVVLGPGGPLDLQAGQLSLTNIQVTRLNLKHVPNWLANNDTVRDYLNAQIGGQKTFDVAPLVRKFLQKGGKLPGGVKPGGAG